MANPDAPAPLVQRALAWLLAHRGAGFALAALLTLVLGALASRVRPDYSAEHLFPAWDPARETYEHYRRQFPGEDARAIVLVSAPDLFDRPGLERLADLEAALAKVPHVAEVLGPASLVTAEKTSFGPQRKKLFDPALSAEELRSRRDRAKKDRLLGWNLLQPDGDGVSILLAVEPAAASTDEGRQRLVSGVETVLARQQRPGERLVFMGVPVVRAKVARLLAQDTGRLVPLAVLVVVLLLYLSFRSAGATAAGLATMLAALVWTFGIPGALGWPQTMVLTVLPIIVIIVSVSDTVHVVDAYLQRLRAGAPPPEALAEALGETAWPCLVTELVLAAGFLSLLFVGIDSVLQFAVCAAAAMLLTWLANFLVLPLALSLVTRAPRGQPRLPALLERHVEWIGAVAMARPYRVLGIAGLILAAAVAVSFRLQKVYYVFDDLRPGSTLEREIRLAERVYGGLALWAIQIDTDHEGDALDPALVRLADRGSAFLRTLPEIRQANSLADVLRPAHWLLAGDDPESDGLPDSREGAAQELVSLVDVRLTREFLSADRRSLAVVGRSIDAGSVRIGAMYEEIEAWVAREQAALDARSEGPRARIRATGQMGVFKDLNDLLLGGLVGSFAAAVLVSLIVMSLALRSVRLGLVAMVPNVAPIALVLAFMALAGIALTPVTVMVFSVTLVIADDDTIQFMVRFRRRFAERKARGDDDARAHAEAAVATLREAGPPMMVSGIAVSLGFLVLAFSEFLGPARFGVLVAATLFAAVLADVYVSPVLLAKLQPLSRAKRSGGAGPGEQAPPKAG